MYLHDSAKMNRTWLFDIGGLMSNKVGFLSDLDGVLFRIDEFKERRIQAAAGLGISRSRYEDTYKKVKVTAGFYDESKQIDLLFGNDRTQARALKIAWGRILRSSKDLAYRDAEEFLQFVKIQPQVDRFLVSRGERALQSAKLTTIGFSDYFPVQTYVNGESKGPSIIGTIRAFSYKIAIFVDDKRSELYDVQTSLSNEDGLDCKVYLIWLNRYARLQNIASLADCGTADPLDGFTEDIIPVSDLGTLKRMFPRMLKGGRE